MSTNLAPWGGVGGFPIPTASDVADGIGCGAFNPTALNGYLYGIHQCLLEMQTQQTQFFEDIEERIANLFTTSGSIGEVYVQSVSEPGTLTLPAGGQWAVIITAHGDSGNNLLTSGSTVLSLSGDQGAANNAGVYSGGTSWNVSVSGGNITQTSLFAIRIS